MVDSDYIVAVKKDGTVLATGEAENGECNVSDWSDIVAIDNGGYYYTVGLKSDGSLIFAGQEKQFEDFVSEKWTGILTPQTNK